MDFEITEFEKEFTVRPGRKIIEDKAPWRQSKPVIRIVLPAYNEALNVGQLLQRIDETLYDSGYPYEILVVDDGSKDDTERVVRDRADVLPVKILKHLVNQGLGATMRDGLMAAAETAKDRDIIIVMDADNTHNPGLILSMIRSVFEGSDVVIASRYQVGSYVRGVSLVRRFLSYAASLLFRVAFPTPGVRDFTCGYRAYRASLLKEAFRINGREFIDQTGFQCMVDIVLKLRAMNAIFREVPLILRYDQKEGVSKMKVLSTIQSTLALMLRRKLQN